MQDLARLNLLIDKASSIYGNDSKLAKALGTSRALVSDWRHGRKEPGTEKQEQLAKMAGLDAGYHVAAAAIEKTGNADAMAWLEKMQKAVRRSQGSDKSDH